MEDALLPDVQTVPFSWRTALWGDYDLLQVHWPEYLVRHRRPLVAWGKRQAFRLLLRRLRHRHVPIVRTLHNVRPHEAGRQSEDVLLARLDAMTTEFVVLNDHTPPPADAPVTLIPHGHYRHLPANTGTPVLGRILFFGIIKPYKGIEALIEAFASVPEELGASLRIVGRAVGDARAMVESSLAGDERITARLEYVDDAELTAEIVSAELVVLPIRDLHNSGSLFRALSLARPVLVPATRVTVDLASEVGGAWVMTYTGELTPGGLVSALAAAGEVEGAPALQGRSWDDVAAAYRAVYVTAGSRVGKPSPL
jgi:beta-1,4-mannosyltransferase